MKKAVLIAVGLVLTALAVVILAVSLRYSRPGISMTLVEYKRWPHGAMVRLTNGTMKSIRYLAENNGTPAGYPLLCAQKTSEGWTTPATALTSATAYQGTPNKGSTDSL